MTLALNFLAYGCARTEPRVVEVTAYCGCGECNGTTRGSWALLKLDFWNRTNADGSPYTGRTASGTRLHLPHPGLVSLDSLNRPWMIPLRLVCPWLWIMRHGTLAADTDHYPFGTEIYIPGWGWGLVEDRGGAIQGPDRLDAYMWAHAATERWGRKRLTVQIAQ